MILMVNSTDGLVSLEGGGVHDDERNDDMGQFHTNP